MPRLDVLPEDHPEPGAILLGKSRTECIERLEHLGGELDTILVEEFVNGIDKLTGQT